MEERDLKRLRNTSGIPDATVKGIVDWIARRLGITQFDVEFRSSSSTIVGRAYIQGSRSYHGNRRPFVVLRIGTDILPATITPYQYAQHKGKRYVLANRIEALVYLAAHELRHLWQAARWTDRRKSAALPMYHGSKEKFSEVDTQAFAISMLREWRRNQ